MTSQILTKHSENEKLLGWKFLTDGGRMNHDMSHIEVTAGLEVRLSGEKNIVACQYGLHYSVRAIDALPYAESNWVARVEDIGDQRVTSENDKVATNALRFLSDPMDVERTLHEFAIWCAEQALSLIENPDPRSLGALEVKRRWLAGKATDEELRAARDAARATAWDATWDAARAATWDAARDAAWDAQNQKLERMVTAEHKRLAKKGRRSR